ncbi:hypothetical protein CMETHOX_25650 [Lacrimispora indolis]|nr:hypothetical protein CMETHOX_25650 [[Clostridium] methoxybenzovorans]
MQELTVNIEGTDLQIKEFNGQRVVTFKDIDAAHERPEGTARKRFNDNKKRFVEGEDYFVRKTDEAKNEFGVMAPNGLVLVTESGYMMLSKSLNDDRAWAVHRSLVNNYFRFKETSVQVNELSPELQMFKQIFDSVAAQQLKQKEQDEKLNRLDNKVESIKEVIALDPNSWKEDSRKIVNAIALSMGGFEHVRDVRAESYRLLDERMASNLSVRLTNMRRRMADNGVCKSKRDKVTKVDVIADDKKLIQGYIGVMKDMAIKYGITDQIN